MSIRSSRAGRSPHGLGVLRPLLVACALLLPAPALAEVPSVPVADLAEEADLQFELGVNAYRRGDFLKALEHLLASNRLVPNRNVVFNIARTYEQLGRYAQAWRHFADFLAVEEDEARRAPAEAAMERLREHVALLEVATDPPGATLFVDRRDLGPRGVTPRALALEPGARSVIVELDGHDPAEAHEVELSIGEVAQVALSLEPILGTLRVEGTEGAEIRLDDTTGPLLGTVPGTLQLPPGAHLLVVSAPGHQVDRQMVQVRPRLTTQAVFELPIITGTVVVNAIERNALIKIGEQALGFTPAVLHSVPAGPHRLEVTLPGFEPFVQHIEVHPDEPVTVDVRMRPRQEVTAASRAAESVEEAPASVSLISRQEIRAFGYQTLYDAVAGTRGIYQTNDRTYEALGVRGFSRSGDYGNRILITLDGHTLNDDQLGGSYVGHDLLGDLLDIEQIEVVRGPGSALYGTSAFFGVINLVTRQREPGAHVSVATDGVRLARARAGTGGQLGASGGYWLSATGTLSQGEDFFFREFVDEGLGDGVSAGADGHASGTFALKAWSGDLTFQAFYNTRDKRIPTGAFETVLADPRAHSHDTRAFGEVRWEPAAGERVQMYNRLYLDLAQFRGGYPYEDELILDRWDGLWAGVEPRMVAELGEAFELTAGAELRSHFHARLVGEDEEEVYLDESPTFLVAAAYAVGEVVSSNRVRASLGARLDHYSTFGTSVNPRAAFILKPTEAGVLKLLGGRAYRAPSPYELWYNDDGYTQVPAPNLHPETIYTGELEYTHRFDDVVSLTTSVFYNQIHDLVDVVELDDEDFLIQYQNTDEIVRTAGLELEVRREWRERWMLAVSQSFQRTRLGDLRDGDRLSNSPAWLGSLKAAAPISGFTTVASRLRVESPRLTLQDEWTEPALLWDVTVAGEVPASNLEYAFGVRNLFDWRFSHPGGEDLLIDRVPQQGRTLFASAKLRF